MRLLREENGYLLSTFIISHTYVSPVTSAYNWEAKTVLVAEVFAWYLRKSIAFLTTVEFKHVYLQSQHIES